ncbi:MAG: response regulator [Gammaproteobacteria bacterium]|jgi:two-component system response regulator BaeR|nr:response regulator [Gammaproteobacteria bacterium]MBT3488552.1 response regulator [Gammaproteobacteria bacterium]MBT3719371.1 response regulator [Gammaproteobacteria bacterium]MBT3843717.1 response regulator [Gammaproteobacteria bacterium]MBT3892273.1 response regulator [Gammaproteobacteria bacterium]
MNTTESQHTVLVVEDEAKIAQLLQDYLHNSGYNTHWIEDGEAVVEWVQQQQPDLILLDLMLPGKDGITICQELRAFTEVPIIMVTARIEEIDRVLGLEIGANDYICKPFSPREVMARVKALFRTLAYRQQPSNRDNSTIVLNPERMQATIFGHVLELTVVEFRLLATLVNQPGRIFSRAQLMENLYEDRRVVTDRTVDSHVKNLRKKIAEHHSDSEIIKSVYGVGYKFEESA